MNTETVNVESFCSNSVVGFLYDRKNEILLQGTGINERLEGGYRHQSTHHVEELPEILQQIRFTSMKYQTRFIVPKKDVFDNDKIDKYLLVRDTATSNLHRIRNAAELLFDPQNVFALTDWGSVGSLKDDIPAVFLPTCKKVVVVDPSAFTPPDTCRGRVLMENLIALSATKRYVFAFHHSCADLCEEYASAIKRLTELFAKEYPRLAMLFAPPKTELASELPVPKRSKFDCGWSCWAVQTAADMRINEEALKIREIYAVAGFSAIGTHGAYYLGTRVLSSTEGVAKLAACAARQPCLKQLFDKLSVLSQRHIQIKLRKDSIDLHSWHRIEEAIGPENIERFNVIDLDCAIASLKDSNNFMGVKSMLNDYQELKVESATFLQPPPRSGSEAKKVIVTNIRSPFVEAVGARLAQLGGTTLVRLDDGHRAGFGEVTAKFKTGRMAESACALFNDKLVGGCHLISYLVEKERK